jgi:predicted transposase YbfD/YdcC
LLRTLTSFFASSTRRAQAATITAHHTVKGHGRLETYRLRATTALNSYLMHEYGWPSVGHVLCIEHTREMLASGQVIHMVHYAITSLTVTTPEQLLELWHEHWHIENKNHWVRDVVFGEDASRARSGTLPEALALLRATVMARLRLSSMDGITAARSQASADFRIAAFLVGIP